MNTNQSAGATQRHVALRLVRRFSAAPQRVFNAWLNPQVAGKWLFATASRPMTHVAIDARVGGSFCFAGRRDGRTITRNGKYLEIVPHRRLVFTLSMENRARADTRVIVEIAPRKRGCELTLSHQDLPPNCVRYTEARWIGVLYGLGLTL